MIVVKPFEGEKINVSLPEVREMNRVVDNSAGKYSKPGFIVELFEAANQKNSRWVYLRSEGWHQYEQYNGAYYKHITLHLSGWTYHFYTKVSGPQEEITSATHRIDTISYVENGNSYTVNPS